MDKKAFVSQNTLGASIGERECGAENSGSGDDISSKSLHTCSVPGLCTLKLLEAVNGIQYMKR
jgi:hypothetical protein